MDIFHGEIRFGLAVFARNHPWSHALPPHGFHILQDRILGCGRDGAWILDDFLGRVDVVGGDSIISIR